MSRFEDARLRANPSYELVLLDRLAPAEQALLDELDRAQDVYGMLRPHAGSELDARSASSDTALLFLTLSEPAPLPGYVRTRLGDDVDRTIGRLVLDGILEIELDGAFRSGPGASELLVTRRPADRHGKIAALSAAALRYGQELLGLPEPLIAQRLYFYGRRPVSPRLRQKLADEHAVATAAGTLPGGLAHRALEAGWVAREPIPSERSPWRQWQPRAAAVLGQPPGAGYKLYVSPAVDMLEHAVAAIAEDLQGARGVSAFKLGSDVAGVCRPDKLVVYFDRLDDLHAGAALLRERLAGCPAHGVPFTAAVTADGLLSWGADPPVASSWRMWVAERLAEYLCVAGDADGGDADGGQLEPWRFALERLRLSGVDTDTWVPASGMWPEALASA